MKYSSCHWHCFSKQHGFTLVELMVAMTIGLFLTAGIISLLIGTRQSYRTDEAIAAVQESGRFAMEALAQEFRQTGNLGCQRELRISEIISTLNLGNLSLTEINKWILDYSNAKWLEGFDAQGSTFSPSSPDGPYSAVLISSLPNIDTDGDVIVSRRVQEAVYRKNRVISHVDQNADLLVDTGNGLVQGDIVLVSNCENATIFQITNSSPSTGGRLEHVVEGSPANAPGNISTDLGLDFAESTDPNSNGEFYRLSTRIYYIDENSAREQPGLFVKDGLKNAEELIEGVYRMEIFYGINNHGNEISTNDPDILNYVSANELGTAISTAFPTIPAENYWNMVNSVRVTLIIGSSEDNVVDVNMSLPLPEGASFDAADRRFYQSFTTTIYLRNKIQWLNTES